MKTKFISTSLVLCVSFVLLVLCSCGGGGGDDTLLRCGDGIVDADLGETCDDGNTDDGDDCPADCILVSVSDICGDGVQGLTEECDDGDTDSEDGCSSVCKLEYCGDGVTQVGLSEACDDGNLTSNDGCSSVCQVDTAITTETACGDGADNDDDGLVDCADGDCASATECGTAVVTTETLCSDGLDDDSDGTVDCADSDCAADAACIVVDTDGDGVADESDPDQDGDGLCDKVDETQGCSAAIDTQPESVTHFYYVDHYSSTANEYSLILPFMYSPTYYGYSAGYGSTDPIVVGGVLDPGKANESDKQFTNCGDAEISGSMVGVCVLFRKTLTNYEMLHKFDISSPHAP